jgi:peptidoglycan/xylan/chitin deacetylase (PgdA/CDA1 family)
MVQRLERYDAITSELGIRPTWPTTACVLARHPEVLQRLAARGAEVAVHGLVHGDHAAMDRRRQRDTIGRAMRIFEHAGLDPTGFRGPYLRYNQATLEVLRELGFRYHSSQAVHFPLRGDATPSYALALKLYSAIDARDIAVIPRLRDGLVDMPVAIPDDETLVERLRWTECAAASQWCQVLDLTHARGDLLTLQLHPERIPELGNALYAVLGEARRRVPSIFIARLDQIASWWLRRSRFTLRVTGLGDCRYRVQAAADADATLLVRGLAVAAEPWYGHDQRTDRFDFETRSPRIPVVGVSGRSPGALRAFLAEEGLPIEISDDAGAYGAYVDVATPRWSEAEVLREIETAPGPLVRIWRWPDGARSALAVTGDVDALTLRDFVTRSWETRTSFRGWQRT